MSRDYRPGSVLVGGGDADEVGGQGVGEALFEQGLGVTQTVGRGDGGGGRGGGGRCRCC